MKRYRITLKERTFDVKVLDDPHREQVRVEVDGEIFVVGVETVPAAEQIISPRSRKTSEIAGGSERNPRVSENETSQQVEDSRTCSGHARSSTVAAPLPGVIKSIAVRAGQQVAPEDELLVIEAMKMDNVIRAARAGTIGAIHVTEGRQVAYGETLLDFADGGQS